MLNGHDNGEHMQGSTTEIVVVQKTQPQRGYGRLRRRRNGRVGRAQHNISSTEDYVAAVRTTLPSPPPPPPAAATAAAAPMSPPKEITISTDSFPASRERNCSSPSLSSTTSCTSDVSDDSAEDSTVDDASTTQQQRSSSLFCLKSYLFGCPSPLLICLIVSVILLPCQVMLYHKHYTSDATSQRRYLCKEDPHHRSLKDEKAPPAFLDIPLDIRTNPTNTNIDALVFIATGPAASAPVLGWSVHSAVQVGGWNGPVYVITDKRDVAAETLKLSNTTAIKPELVLEPENLHIIEHQYGLPDSLSSFNAKLTKCQLLKILPDHLQHIIYIDADIIIGRPLAPLWNSIDRKWEHDLQDEGSSAHDDLSVSASGGHTNMILFEDVKSYTAGRIYCKDCDTWNTGVMSIRRGKSDSCLKAWCNTLSLKGGTDQAALDAVISNGSECQNIQALELKHVRMMKDVFVVWGAVGTKTFNHFTGIFRPENLSALHRGFYERMLGKKLPHSEQRTSSLRQQILYGMNPYLGHPS